MAKIYLTADAYDACPADEFLHPPRPGEVRITSRMKRSMRWRRIAELQRTQNTGLPEPTQWRRRYERHLQSGRWERLKNRVLQKRGNMCERCGASGSIKRLDLHHISYARMGREAEEDVKLYCRDCHNAMHSGKLRSR